MTRTAMSPELKNQDQPRLLAETSADPRAGGSASPGRRARGHRAPAREGAEDGPRADRALARPGRAALELGLWAGYEMYAEWGGAPAAGVLTVIGSVHGRRVMVVANDATVKAGACFPLTIKKILRAQAIAASNRLPLVYLVDSSGVFLPMQDEVFPDDDDFGRIFRNNAVLSAQGIPQYAAIMGNCVAGGAYLPVLCDTVLMTEGSGLYLAGPALVKAAIGQNISHEELGGAQVHAAYQRHDRLSRARRRLLPGPPAPAGRSAAPRPGAPVDATAIDAAGPARRGSLPRRPHRDLGPVRRARPAGLRARRRPVRRVSRRVRQDARLRLRPSGGNAAGDRRQPAAAVPRRGGGPFQFGGVIYADSADKAARFVLECNQSRLPILFIQDVNGFDVGRDAERSGIIRRGAKLVSAVSNSTVPKITLIVGHSFGAGHYALCGKAFDPRFLFAWPGARYAVMGAQQAARTMLDVNVATLKRQGKAIDQAELDRLTEELRQRYDRETDIRYAAARLWIDAIIEPARTREVLIQAFDVATRCRETRPITTGVFQV